MFKVGNKYYRKLKKHSDQQKLPPLTYSRAHTASQRDRKPKCWMLIVIDIALLLQINSFALVILIQQKLLLNKIF